MYLIDRKFNLFQYFSDSNRYFKHYKHQTIPETLKSLKTKHIANAVGSSVFCIVKHPIGLNKYKVPSYKNS